MRCVHLDFETYSECEISDGVVPYSSHPSTEVLCAAWAAGDGPVQLWLPGDEFPPVFSCPGVVISAWNVSFERAILERTLKMNGGEPRRWRDTMVEALVLGLPASLGMCTSALGFSEDKAKDKKGRGLIRKLCMPGKDGERCTDESMLSDLYAYCKQDVIAEREISRKVRRLSDREYAIWCLDQSINDRGVRVDAETVKAAIRVYEAEDAKLLRELQSITKSENPRSQTQFFDWLNSRGVCAENVQKSTLEAVNSARDTPEDVKTAIALRLSLARTPVKKYSALLRCSAPDNIARNNLRFHKASTGRWAGAGINLQNMPRLSDEFRGLEDQVISAIRTGKREVVGLLFGDAIEVLARAVRYMLIPREGCRFIVCDFSSIEARVLAWLASETRTLTVFRTHGKLYEATAASLYHKHIDEISKSERFLGKVSSLSLGYGGGKGALTRMAKTYGKDIDEDEAEEIKVRWRQDNSSTVKFWHDVERAAIKALTSEETERVGKVSFRLVRNVLFCRLPSGRTIAYQQPFIAESAFGNDALHYYGVESSRNRWTAIATYGGKLVENITQAVARDLLAEALLRLDRAGYPVVLHVHDEIIADVPFGEGSVEHFEKIMCELPCWADGLPLSAEAFECDRYSK